ncbi:MAG: choice-of-anchor D domain-containing protein [bacterium]
MEENLACKLRLALLMTFLLTNFVYSQPVIWEQTNGPFGGYINTFAVDSNDEIYVGTSGAGVYRSFDDGDSWTQVIDGLTTLSINALVIGSEGQIFAGGGGVFRSPDRGETWVAVNNGLTNTFIKALSVNSTGEIFAGSFGGGVFRSMDNGDSWVQMNNGLTDVNIFALAINSSDSIFAATNSGIFRSADNGDSWTQVNNDLPDISFRSLTVGPNDTVFAGAYGAAFSGGGVYRTENSGDSWTLVKDNLTRVLSIVVKSSGDIFAGTESGVFRCQKSKTIWTPINNGLSDPKVQALAVNSQGDLFAGTLFGGGVFRSRDNGDTWAKANNGLVNSRVTAIAVHPDGQVFAGVLADIEEGFGYGMFRSSDNGDNWIEKNNGLTDLLVTALAINASGDIFAGTAGSVFRSLDNGDSWTETKNGLPSNNEVHTLAINSSGEIFVGMSGSGVYRSSDNGDSWQEKNNGLQGQLIVSLAINSSEHLFAGAFADGGIFRSLDNGDTWLPIQNGFIDVENTDIVAIAINSMDHIFLGTFPDGIYKSVDNGDTWEQLDSGLNDTIVSTLVINSAGHIFAGTGGGISLSGIGSGVFFSRDNGETWSPINSGLTNSTINTLARNSQNIVFAGTSRGGVYRSLLPSLSLSSTIVDFGEVTINQTREETLTLGNTGQAELIVDSISFKNGNAGFVLTSPQTFPVTVTPHSSLPVVLGFSPSFEGAETDTLIILSSDPASSHAEVSLSGVGIPLAPSISISSTELDFGEVSADTALDLSMTVTNLGGADLILQNVTFSQNSGDFVLVSPEVFPLAITPEDSLPVIVRFSPSSPGEKVDTLNFQSNDPAHPLITVAVKGIGSTPTSVSSANRGIPNTFKLEQNYPNPFNPETRIEFQLPNHSHVTIKIFNTLGQEIRTLVNAPYSGGYHSVRWDGKDNGGRAVASGIYLYQLQAGNFTHVRKMSLLR